MGRPQTLRSSGKDVQSAFFKLAPTIPPFSVSEHWSQSPVCLAREYPARLISPSITFPRSEISLVQTRKG